jgi:hypothetical protein
MEERERERAHELRKLEMEMEERKRDKAQAHEIALQKLAQRRFGASVSQSHSSMGIQSSSHLAKDSLVISVISNVLVSQISLEFDSVQFPGINQVNHQSVIEMMNNCSVNSACVNAFRQFYNEDEIDTLSSKLKLNLLQNTSEGPFQVELNSMCDLMRATNTSQKSDQRFHMCRMVGKDDHVFPLNAKADIGSLVCPMVIEVKASGTSESSDLINSDVDVLSQAMQRVFVARSTNAAIKNFVAIAITFRSAWVVEFERKIEAFRDGKFESIKVNRIFKHGVDEEYLENLDGLYEDEPI